VNPNAVKEHYRAVAREHGVEFLDRKLVVEIGREGDRVTSARVRRLPDEDSAHESLEGREATGPEAMIAVDRMVNAAGPWAGQVARLLGAPVHTRAVPRQISVSACRDVDLSGEGMIVDTTGVYLHHESGDLILTGYSPPGDPPGYRFRYEGAAFFEREIWPRLAARISAMDRLQHVRGWAGLYELSPDNSALLGRVEGLENAFEIHSFSGRGVMQSHAAALSLAELMTTGAMRTHPSAGQLSAERFALGEPQFEDLHI
jgi:glycine/D-amino acid oxidase-like deaminating enzyme